MQNNLGTSFFGKAMIHKNRLSWRKSNERKKTTVVVESETLLPLGRAVTMW